MPTKKRRPKKSHTTNRTDDYSDLDSVCKSVTENMKDLDEDNKQEINRIKDYLKIKLGIKDKKCNVVWIDEIIGPIMTNYGYYSLTDKILIPFAAIASLILLIFLFVTVIF